MKFDKIVTGLLFAILFFSVGNAVAKTKLLSDAQVKDKIIAESIVDYPGICACPFNQARNGSSCGRRSAWSKAGGYSPICYQNEVTAEMIKEWRERNS